MPPAKRIAFAIFTILAGPFNCVFSGLYNQKVLSAYHFVLYLCPFGLVYPPFAGHNIWWNPSPLWVHNHSAPGIWLIRWISHRWLNITSGSQLVPCGRPRQPRNVFILAGSHSCPSSSFEWLNLPRSKFADFALRKYIQSEAAQSYPF